MNVSVPIRPLTSGPRYHWFGYYDKLQFDPGGRRVLGMEVGFDHREVEAGDEIRLGMIDTSDGDRWVDFGKSRAWCWQQGCMLQWLPGTASSVIWNDREDGGFVSRVLDVDTGEQRTLPMPIYSVSPDGRTAVVPDFRRLKDTRPGYGYAGVIDPNTDVNAPKDSGIWRMDLSSGKSELIVGLDQVAAMPCSDGDISDAKHWFNHLLWNPSGTRFVFLHRWRPANSRGHRTRMLTSAPDGGDLRIVEDCGMTSHFIWRDDTHILAWSHHRPEEPGFYMLNERTGAGSIVGPGVMTGDGHCSYLPGGDIVLNDTYPTGEARLQELYLYDMRSGVRTPLGGFQSPASYTGMWRCDLHPRSSRDGRLVTIDSAHGGDGRQIYLLDISGLLGG